MSILEGLNPQQLEAVTLPHQSALILAGAGSGKTRVLTTRIAWLIQTGQIGPLSILAVTFTNKAAREMLTRISAMLPINTRGMWVGTFHGLCNRILRAHYRDAGLPQAFQILDSADQLAVIKRVMKAMNVDDEKYPPRQAQNFINSAKEQGLRAAQVDAPDDFSRRLLTVYEAYEAQCNREGVVDFAELLLRCYELLGRNELLQEHYRGRFKHILVDEFQDTNRLQYHWLKLLAGPNNTIFAVGDDDQCLPKGTRITLADGSTKPIEQVRKGDHVLSCYGTGDFRPAEVQRVHRDRRRHALVTLHTNSGRKLSSTPEHTHFAGYLLGETPQTFFTYLMFKRGMGYRIGTSQVYTRGQRRPMVGYKQRAIQEHADALWIIGTHARENEARAEEMILSLRYGLPTLPFVPRKGSSRNGLVHDPDYISRVFRSLDTEEAARRLMADFQLAATAPHHRPHSRDSLRRNVMVTLCGDRRGASPMHRIAIMGNDRDGKQLLRSIGLSVRPAKRGSRSWRFETVRKDFGELMAIAQRVAKVLKGEIILRANLNGRSLPFIEAAHVRPGMALVDQMGKTDVVSRVEHHSARTHEVFDLDVTPTHNYVANGLVTHNSIYAFRGAHAGNMLDLEKDFRIQKVIKLEQNYRSHGNILDAANALIRHNRTRLGKNLWTSEGNGEPLRVYEAMTDIEEAAYIVDEVRQLHNEGVALSDMALLYRSNAQSRVLEHALFNAGISYRVYGGLRFFERQEIKHALAYLRLTANPDDDGAFLRVVNFPTRGIGNRSLEQLQEAAAGRGIALWQAACANTLGGKAGSSIAAFIGLIGTMRKACENLPLPEIVDHVVATSGLIAHYQTEKEGADRIENLNELTNAAAAFVGQDGPITLISAEGEIRSEGLDPLNAFLAHAALEAGEHQAGEGADALQLMTVHSAKGLEFHTVFISGLEEGLFPHENSLSEQDGLEEERRLMYVALTRARRRLYLTHAQTRMLHGQTRYNVPSRFFDEIPDELLKRINTTKFSGFVAAKGYEAVSETRAPKFETGASGWRIGQNVVHPKFGAGVIVNAEGRGSDARVQVNFRNAGLKWLALDYAKLVPA